MHSLHEEQSRWNMLLPSWMLFGQVLVWITIFWRIISPESPRLIDFFNNRKP
jgi:hypothetical protein